MNLYLWFSLLKTKEKKTNGRAKKISHQKKDDKILNYGRANEQRLH